MNEQQALSCKRIFEAVTRRPVARLFWEVTAEVANDEITRPITFSHIKDKLDRALYPNPASFINDMRQIFLNGDTYDKEDSIRPHAVALLMDDFEKALNRYAPTATSLEIRLQISLDDYNKITQNNFGLPKQTKSTSLFPQKKTIQPSSHYFRIMAKDPHSITKADLNNEIRLLKTPNLVIQLVQFIRKLQPEVIQISNGISIITSLLTADNIIKTHEFIYNILKDAAVGDIETPENQINKDLTKPISQPAIIPDIVFHK